MFQHNDTEEQLQQRLDNAESTLTAFFAYNLANEDGRQYLYHEFPQYFVFEKSTKRWHRRKKQFSIGRMYHCNPFNGERYYLRLLLTIIRGPKSFEDLRTINGHLYTTFKEACKALGLLEDDTEWIQCFKEAISFQSGRVLRTLFVTALVYGEVSFIKSI